MATLHVRSIPDSLYRKVERLARAEKRSISREVIALLEEAVERNGDRREATAAILDRIRARRDAIRLPQDWPGSLRLLRADRAR